MCCAGLLCAFVELDYRMRGGALRSFLASASPGVKTLLLESSPAELLVKILKEDRFPELMVKLTLIKNYVRKFFLHPLVVQEDVL